jgi:signal transduction histidine kinase
LVRDRLLLSAFVVCGLLIGYQIGVTLAHPVWIGPVTDWLRAALAWPELLIVASVSLWLSRAHHSAAWSWWMWSAALLSYTVARTLWTISDQLLFHHGVPFPTFPDLFFVLQYPFFFLAVILLPRTKFWGSRLILTLDGVLAMGAVTAFSWNFLLEPLYTASGISPLARSVSLSYPIGDLFVLFGLTMTLLRPSRYWADRLVLQILVIAVISLIAADSWVGVLLLTPPHVYRTGNPPDVFWLAFYLLVPLAALCQLRLAQHAPPRGSDLAVKEKESASLQRSDFTASLRFFFPIVVALLASGAIIIHATMQTVRVGWKHEIVSFAVSASLLLLILVRQQITFLEIAQLRREAEYARASEQAMRVLNQRKDEFLGIVSHELRTPLTILKGYLELLARRFSAWRPTDREAGELARNIATARTAIQYSEESVRRIVQLVDELLDDTRIRDGRFVLHREPCDLGVIVRKAVEEQQALAPERTIRLETPTSTPVPVVADARRIAQVVTNYLTNALKYSKEDQPVAVRLEVTGDQARVSVRDEGIGVPAAEQARVWERFHVVEGNKVQSGSGVSLGIGLHISRSIIAGHQGQVGVQSVPSHGATFWFTLPLAPPPVT